MGKEKIIIPAGNNKALVYDADLTDPEQKIFADEIKQVANTNPQSIQEFFVRLAELQKNKEAGGMQKETLKPNRTVRLLKPGNDDTGLKK